MGNCSSGESTNTVSQNGKTPREKTENHENKQGNNKGNSTDGYPQTHIQCRGGTYPREDDVLRFPVPDDKVHWNVDFEDYSPMEFFAEMDVPIEEDKNFSEGDHPVTWNAIDGHVNRTSFQGVYEIIDKLPRNPVGRTGLKGRGRLARYGPNHAADPIVTRWKKDPDTDKPMKHPKSGKYLLEFISIQRGDSKQWAIPGGFVDAGEEVFSALKREFGEEAMNSDELDEQQKQSMKENLDKLFSNGKEVYRGYVDDPRNTDQSWMETVAVNFHDEDGDMVKQLKLQAGDDAVGVRWADVSCDLDLYASHEDMVKRTAELLNAHW